MKRTLTLLALAAVAGCTSTLAPHDLGPARERWASLGLHDYSYVYEQTGFFTTISDHQVRVFVIQDTVRFVRDALTGDTLPWPANGFPTIDQLFDRAVNAAAVTYDATYGYPRRMDFPGLPDASGSVFASGLEAPGACSLTGAWGWSMNFNPGGSYLNLFLSVDGNRITGAGAAAGVGPLAPVDSLTVSGRVLETFAPPPGFALTLAYRSGRVIEYEGSVICPDTLSGTATPSGGQSYSLVLIRGRTVN